MFLVVNGYTVSNIFQHRNRNVVKRQFSFCTASDTDRGPRNSQN